MFEITLSRVDQVEDTAGPGNDEPYVIVFAADLADTGLIPIPAPVDAIWAVRNWDRYWISREIPPGSGLCWGFRRQAPGHQPTDNPLILVALLDPTTTIRQRTSPTRCEPVLVR